MGRRPTIDETKLLETARAVFAELGADASTEVVAKRAGVSVGSLFRRWPTKEALLAAASHVDADLPWLRALQARVGVGDLNDALVETGEEAVEAFRVALPALVLGWSRPATRPESHADPFVHALREVATWFEAEMQLGRLRRADPEVVARTWLGALAQFALSERTAHLNDPLPLSRHTFVRGLADLLTGPPSNAVTPPTPAKVSRAARRS